MLTPDELKVAPDNIVALYQQLEDDIIADIARRLEKAGEITGTAEWQIYMLTEMGKDLDDIKSKIAEVNHKSKVEVENLFDEAIARSVGRDNLLFQQAGKGTLDLAKNTGMQQFIAANAAKTAGDLKNLTKSLGFKDGKQFKPIARFYQDTLNYAQFQIASGAFSYQQAIKIATAKMVESGIRVVDYESGVSTRVDVAVRRATLTGINQTSGVITMRWLDELGGEYVEVTAHMGARPDHATWQGKVYKVNGSDKDYPNLADSTGYGSVTGLKGANCRHDFNPFFPGISERNYTDQELENIDPPPFEYNGKTYTHYEATQKQRQIERAIRKTKQEMIVYDATGLKKDFTSSAVKLQRQKELYRDFSAKAGLRTKDERHQLYGFGKSVGQKGVQTVMGEARKEADKLISKFRGLEPKVTEDLLKIANSAGGKMFGLEYSIKSRESLTRKIMSDAIEKKIDFAEASLEIKDVLRYTIIYDDLSIAKKYFDTVEELRSSGYNVVRVKNTFMDGQAYKGINTIVSDSKGNLFELQYHTPKSIEVKEGGLHELYEKQRKLDPSRDFEQYKSLIDEMVKLSDTIPIPDGIERIK